MDNCLYMIYIKKPSFLLIYAMMKYNNKKLIVANWKMNKSVLIADNFIKELCGHFRSKSLNICDVAICPSFHLLDSVGKKIITENIKLGAQDCSAFAQNEGAFTGDISAGMLKDLGCDYVIIGHSERRIYNKESNDIVKQKVIHALNAGLDVILCVGENLEQRNNKAYKEFISKMLEESLPEELMSNKVIIAYEPVWAIGTGVSASYNQIEEMHQYLYEKCLSRFAMNLNIIYGGSVNSDNAKDILNIDKVYGLLIGGASLDASKFHSIIKTIEG